MRRYLLAFTIPLVLGILSVFLALVMIYFHPSLTVALLALFIGAISGSVVRDNIMEGRAEKPASVIRRIVGTLLPLTLILSLLALVLVAYVNRVSFQMRDLIVLFVPGALSGYLLNWCSKHPPSLREIPIGRIVLWLRLKSKLQASPTNKGSSNHRVRTLSRPHRR